MTYKRFYIAVIALLVVVLSHTSILRAQQAQMERIAAVVNDDVVSFTDVSERLKLIMASSGIQDTPDMRRNILPQVINALIDERIKLQAATELEISVTQEQTDQGFSQIAQQNNLTADQFRSALKKQGINPRTLEKQVEAQIAWSGVIRQELRPQVTITDNDIQAVIDRFRDNSGKTEYNVAEIYLPVTSEEQEHEVRSFAQKIVQQMISGQAPFSGVARQFSQSASAVRGGSVGWVQQGQLPKELDDALAQMNEGQVSPPIKTLSGYYILMNRGERRILAPSPSEVELNLKQIFLSATSDNKDQKLKEAHDIAENLTGCLDIQKKAKDQYAGPKSGDLGMLKLADLPKNIAQTVESLDIGTASKPVAVDDGVIIVMVCKRKQPPSNIPTRNDIEQQLVMERLEMLQRRHLLDLRSSAFIERRLQG